jgi:hypothetical protein
MVIDHIVSLQSIALHKPMKDWRSLERVAGESIGGGNGGGRGQAALWT